MSLKVTGPVRNGKWCLSPFQWSEYLQFFKKCKEGQRVCGEFKIERKSKSWSQVKCHWGLMVLTIKESFDDRGIDTSYLLKGVDKPTGNAVSKDLIHDYLYSVCPMYAEDGERITMSDERCTTVVAMKWFDECRNYVASSWGIHIPDPRPDWRNNEHNRTDQKIPQ